MARYLAQVDDTDFDIEIDYCSEKYCARINGREVRMEFFPLAEGRSIILVDGLSLEVDVRANSYASRQIVFMKGRDILVDIEDYNLAQLRKTAIMSSGGAVEKAIKAPMPGLILEVKIQPGDTVAKNQPILIVEAMKMENIIKAPADGKVKTIHVAKGQSVEKDMKLVEFE